eukprot:GEMP01014491.1.p1 GENE.GEMP01014491.1~~GEMP01014491.1.p1  ORF type:complete len:360 (+),score=60.99 GEMP01014491.1:83-1162(+)
MQLFYILRVCALVQLVNLSHLRMSFVAEAATPPSYSPNNLRKCTRQRNWARTSLNWLEVGEVLSTEDPIKQWSITEVLEPGGMGYVFKAQELHKEPGGQEVVIKVSKQKKDEPSIIEEANMLDRVKNVSQVPNLETLCRADDNNAVLVIEYGGPDLASVVILRNRSLTWPETVCVGMQGLAALQELEKHEVIHLDIKPANLLWAQKKSEKDFCKGTLQIIDFGVARSANSTESTDDGTPFFMSWRVKAGQQASKRDDLFSMALTLLNAHGIYTDREKQRRNLFFNSGLKWWDSKFLKKRRNDEPIDPLLMELYDLGVGDGPINYGDLKRRWAAYESNTPSLPPSQSTISPSTPPSRSII